MARHLVLVCPIDPARRKQRYSSSLSKRRGLLRSVLTEGLREITKNHTARMRYNEHDFWANIVCRLGYKLVGWPDSILFTNLSNVKGGRRPIEELLQLWNNGTLTFVPIDSPAELAALKPQTVRKRAARRDLKSHRKVLTASGKPRCCHHRGAITPLTIDEDVEDSEIKADSEAGGRRLAHGELAEDPIEDA
ncbi:uncharacterized protein C8Q71DRAFT_859832 [Rhodofomes roseus]|uniref:Uncharacterized protein n=1 Tax=Rhodofomes roseus TaxID=34475 RepID=A0ABQ8KAJ8_9APHY|nr:uncharacterized protein C8Q71DRAFT_859832 [Rhodofomes roseus]KAH9834177.1 hypothetical protein C8Q71DRAFT_859832 [Rhodofomes roseus]